MSQLWTEKYFPKNFDEFIGNSEIVDDVERWADNWQKHKKGEALLLFGETGTGKTCLAHMIAKKHDWGLFELNASDLRNKEAIETVAGAAAYNASFSGKPRLVLLDEIDGLQRADRGGSGAIAKIIKQSKNPVILTANDIYANRKLIAIRHMCKTHQFKKINYL